MKANDRTQRRLKRFELALFLTIILSGCVSNDQGVPVFNAGQRTPGTYVVQRGDTLYSIAFRYGLDYRELARLNGVNPPYTILVDQKLKIKGVPKAVERDSGPANPSARTSSNRQKPVVTPQRRQSAATSSKINQAVLKPGDPDWRWPHKGKVLTGYDGGVNKGLDISGKPGDRVNAAAEGVVVYAGGGLRGYGKLVIVKHNNQYLSAYGHNRSINVKEGDSVKRGQKLAEIGATGSQQPILHFEIRKNGKPVNPLGYLPKRK